MKRAAAALRAFLTDGIGLEGGFLALGTGCLAVAASFFHPAGPWAVVGTAAFLVGLLLSLPRRS